MSRNRTLPLIALVLGAVAFSLGRPAAQGPAAAFHAVGDLPGGSFHTTVKDATRGQDGAIYAVGGAVGGNTCLPPCSGNQGNSTDTAIVWRFDGANATLTPLPNIVSTWPPLLGPVAWAITPTASHIAAQLFAQPNPPGFMLRAGRVTTNGLGVLDLTPTQTTGTSAARALSDNGNVIYATTGAGQVRLDVLGATTTPVPAVPPHAGSFVRATSTSGNVAAGFSFTGTVRRALRYEHGAGSTAIPFLSGGNFNDALDISSDGDLMLAVGNSDAYPRGEAYLYRAGTGTIQPLGSPNTAWSPGARTCAGAVCLPAALSQQSGIWIGGMVFGGVTDDGSVVAMSFYGPDGQNGYFRNQHGWFHLASVLGANGIDLDALGWHGIQVQGISRDGTLVFGSGDHSGTVDGFVAEFAPGVLASFNPQAMPPVSTALVGAWTFDDLSDVGHVVIFTAEGAYFHIEGPGFERGLYTYDGSQVVFTTLEDNNGATGLSDLNGQSLSVQVNGDTATDPNDPEVVAHRIAGVANTIVGGWILGDPTQHDSSFAVVFTGPGSGNKYFAATDDASLNNAPVEIGTYTWDPVTHAFQVFPMGAPPDGVGSAELSADALELFVVDDNGQDSFTLSRVIDPDTIPAITNSQLSATGVVGQAFSYVMTAETEAASVPLTFGAAGLPSGLSVNPVSGAITGTPTIGGQFAVTLSATIASGVAGLASLTLTIEIPTPVGDNVTIQPVVPEGLGPVTLTFGEVTSPGTTTVEVVDLEESGIPPPGSVGIAGIVYEVTTTATYEGLITLCFSYAGIDFGAATPRLFHFENNVWVDITTSVHPDTQMICGATTTLSPFAVLVSNVVRTGFYQPVNPIAGVLNVVNGGSTVPLKFEVYIDGVEQTTTAVLLPVSEQQIACDSSAPLDDVGPASTSGAATLRYDTGDGHFVYNWKVPRTPGQCYMVRVTTAQDGLALTARFRVR